MSTNVVKDVALLIQTLEAQDTGKFRRFLALYIQVERNHNYRMKLNSPYEDRQNLRKRRAEAFRFPDGISAQRLSEAWHLYIVMMLTS